MRFVFVFFSLFLVSFLVLSSGCNKRDLGPWDDPLDYFTTYIIDYHFTGVEVEEQNKPDIPGIFIDFSDCFIEAQKDETNKRVIDIIAARFSGAGIDWYGLGERRFSGVSKIDETPRVLFANIIGQPRDIYAPISVALDSIVKRNGDALLITDFEEYISVGGRMIEDLSPFAENAFKDWVSRGNSITFYYAPFIEQGEMKNMYYVFFNYNEITDQSLVRRFEQAISGRISGLNNIVIERDPFKLLNQYGGARMTGLSPDVPDGTDLILGDNSNLLTHFYNAQLNNTGDFEVLEFGWGLGEIHSSYFSEHGRFTRNIFFDASKTQLYRPKSIEIKVRNVTDNFKSYVQSSVALEQQPKFEQDMDGNLIWDGESKKNEIIREAYTENTDKIKPQFIFSLEEGSLMQEVFSIDEDIFFRQLQSTPERAEIITRFHPNFSPQHFKGKKEPTVLRVDVYLNDVDIIISDQLNDFKWNSIIQPNTINESLFHSIQNTIRDLRPKGILYSYYLKFD